MDDESKNAKIRTFDTGATRDTNDGKLDYEAAMHPLVVRRYLEYMQKHTMQPDGTQRDFDNWQQMFGDKHFDVCIKSGWRHFMDWWLDHRGCESRDGIEEAICGLIFNANAYLFKILMGKKDADKRAATADE